MYTYRGQICSPWKTTAHRSHLHFLLASLQHISEHIPHLSKKWMDDCSYSGRVSVISKPVPEKNNLPQGPAAHFYKKTKTVLAFAKLFSLCPLFATLQGTVSHHLWVIHIHTTLKVAEHYWAKACTVLQQWTGPGGGGAETFSSELQISYCYSCMRSNWINQAPLTALPSWLPLNGPLKRGLPMRSGTSWTYPWGCNSSKEGINLRSC